MKNHNFRKSRPPDPHPDLPTGPQGALPGVPWGVPRTLYVRSRVRGASGRSIKLFSPRCGTRCVSNLHEGRPVVVGILWCRGAPQLSFIAAHWRIPSSQASPGPRTRGPPAPLTVTLLQGPPRPLQWVRRPPPHTPQALIIITAKRCETFPKTRSLPEVADPGNTKNRFRQS